MADPVASLALIPDFPFLWADSDEILPLSVGRRFAASLRHKIDHVIPNAGHFLQEDAGATIGALIRDWLQAGDA